MCIRMIIYALIILLIGLASVVFNKILFAIGWSIQQQKNKEDIKTEVEKYYLEDKDQYIQEIVWRQAKIKKIDKQIQCRKDILNDLRIIVKSRL